MMNKATLSKRSEKLFDDFTTAAQRYGWESDQGSAESAAEACRVYVITGTALRTHMLQLEQRIEKLKDEIKHRDSVTGMDNFN